MRRLSALVCVLATVVAVSAGTNGATAAVAVVGVGQVSGTVSLSPGVLVTSNRLAGDACDKQSYTFGSVVLNGVISDGTRTFAGSISTSGVAGGSFTKGDCGDTGEGVVNTPGAPASFSGSTPVASGSGTFFGQYIRVGTYVRVVLSGSGTLCQLGDCASFSNVPVVLDASQFVPTALSSDGRVTQANFTGEFHIGTPEPHVGIPF